MHWAGHVVRAYLLAGGIAGASPLPHPRRDWAHPLPHLRRDWAHPLPHPHRDWAHPSHVCTGTTPATSALGLGSPLPHLHRDWAQPATSAPGTGADRHATRRARFLLMSRGRCSADPCDFVSDGECNVPEDCSFGDFHDCGINATLPDAIGSLVCRSKITRMYCSALPGLSITPSVVALARHSIRRFRLQGLLGFRPGGQRPLEHLCADRTHVAVRPVRPPSLASNYDAGASHACVSFCS